MMQLRRCKTAMQPATVIPLAVLMLGLSAPGGPAVSAAADLPLPTAAAAAPEASAEPATPNGETPNDETPRVIRHGPVRHLTVAQSIDESVRRLARGLDLDPDQQVRLRQILVDQHRHMMQLRSGASGVSGDVTVTMLAIYDQTRARIRAMLNEEQLKKYPAAVPRDQTAPAQADLQHWMQLQETKRKQDDGEPK
jgi:outer membrane receptor protein involved in Fe transport